MFNEKLSSKRTMASMQPEFRRNSYRVFTLGLGSAVFVYVCGMVSAMGGTTRLMRNYLVKERQPKCSQNFVDPTDEYLLWAWRGQCKLKSSM